MTTPTPLPPLDRRINHAVALSVDLRAVVDDQMAGIPHAGNLYRLIPAHVTQETLFAKPQTEAKDVTK